MHAEVRPFGPERPNRRSTAIKYFQKNCPFWETNEFYLNPGALRNKLYFLFEKWLQFFTLTSRAEWSPPTSQT